MDFLAAVNWEDLVMIATGLGILTGVKVVHSKVPRNNGKYNQKVCDERHRNIERDRAEIIGQISQMQQHTQENFKTVFEKLDRLTEHLMK